MKKSVVAVIALAAGLIFVSETRAAEKMAYVDLSRIFSEYNKTKDYDAKLGGKEEAYAKEREKKVAEIKELQDKIDLLSEKEKETKKSEVEGMIKKFQEFDRLQQAELRKEQDERMKELLKDIEDTVKEYSGKEGYALVFNDRVLVYQDKKLEITDKIIELLNKGYKK